MDLKRRRKRGKGLSLCLTPVQLTLHASNPQAEGKSQKPKNSTLKKENLKV